MRGPKILARTMSIAKRKGASEKAWQYHSRSDSHSKLACWTVLFDFMCECDILCAAAREGRVGFGINHVMVGSINKTLDLVVTRLGPDRKPGGRRTFAELADELHVALDDDDRARLAALPQLFQDLSDEVSEVAVALEAKACMTEHIKSLPRLHAEILATGYLAKQAAPQCITVSYSLVNAAERFVSPSGAGKVNVHNQPGDAKRVVEMIERAVPTTTQTREFGYDVVGVTVIDCRNDGSEVRVVEDSAPSPGPMHHLNYERMIRGLCSQFRGRFGR